MFQGKVSQETMLRKNSWSLRRYFTLVLAAKCTPHRIRGLTGGAVNQVWEDYSVWLDISPCSSWQFILRRRMNIFKIWGVLYTYSTSQFRLASIQGCCRPIGQHTHSPLIFFKQTLNVSGHKRFLICLGIFPSWRQQDTLLWWYRRSREMLPSCFLRE